MGNNFDLREFLLENKLGAYSKATAPKKKEAVKESPVSTKVRQIVREVLSEMNEEGVSLQEDKWPFYNHSERVIRDVVDNFIAGNKDSFTFLAARVHNDAQLNAVVDIIKEKLKAKNLEMAKKSGEEFQSRFGPGGSQKAFGGDYSGS